MKILQITNYYYPNIGGIEVVARCLSKSFAEIGGVEQKVICMNNGENKTVKDLVDDVEIIRCKSPIKIASQSLSRDYPQLLKEVLESFNPDVVILHWPNPFTAYFLMRYASRDFKFIVYWHSDIIKQKILRIMFNGLTERMLRRADLILATSPNYIEGSTFLSGVREKCKVLSCCVDEDKLCVTEDILNRANSIRKENDNKIICFAFGRDVPYKGLDYLRKAEKILDKNIKVIIGHKLSQQDLIAHLLACDIFCFPSITKNEAFGIGLAEGMYFERPTVTFTIPGSGVNYVSINAVTGIECENRNTKQYADAIEKLALDPILRERLGKNAKARVEKLFLYKHFKENVQKIISLL